ncbi:MAG TPA: FAD-binding oxidoreductase [Alphaproteobacteria bacterium]|jgi:alkyldihydroxyacetonephosphate synthase|nr:FAD-binding oxidoreductase [Alphaproteobacteria bacterium]
MKNKPRELKFWGWGYADETVAEDEVGEAIQHVCGKLGIKPPPAAAIPELSDIVLSAPRVAVPGPLQKLCSVHPRDRVSHTYGKSFADYARTLQRNFRPAPDVVAYPETEQQLVDSLDWATQARLAVVPFGAGSSVVGGIEHEDHDSERGRLTIDLRKLDQVLEVDKTSRAARIQAGIFGPALDAALKPHGLTLRHFPQSYEFSTLGGWIATRSGGHYATLYTHIDDFVENLRTVTPSGTLESRRLPGSGAGPSPDRLMIGSEGILGVITEAWMRLQDRPTFRAGTAVQFDDFHKAAEAVRAISQAGLFPSNCRLVDADEAAMSGAGDGSAHLVVLGFESADHQVGPWMECALECARDHGGRVPEESGDEGHRSGAAGRWRNAFMRMPYYREAVISRGIIQDTFETSTTWDRFAEFHANVKSAAEDAIRRVTGNTGLVTCRFTHTYPDGPAPYFTFHALSDVRVMLDQWREIKQAASEALMANGGTITHHHAVGRDHRPWYDSQRPDLFADALAAAKRQLDPDGLLNPGVLIDADHLDQRAKRVEL